MSEAMRKPIVRIAGSLCLVIIVGSVLGHSPGGRSASAATELWTPRPEPLVTYQDLLSGLKNPSRWLTYSGDYSGQRHSPLKQITPENAHRLAAQWTFQTETMARGRGYEATPLVVDGVLYATGPNDFAWALDPRTGHSFWRYRRDLPGNLTYGASVPVNRGFGVLADRLFMTTLDAHLVALDMKTGTVLWDIVLADYKIGHSATMAPLVVKDKVIVGISGGDYPTRGFLDAYDPANGKRIWRFYTVPGPGEPGSETWPTSPELLARGGGGTWVTGTFDPELNTLYWGTGNPNPDYYGEDRKGENLYTCSLIAIDVDTGKLKWYYQFTPHDTHDWDSNHVPVLADLPVGGQRLKVVMVANRNGFFYVLDRVTGKVLLGKPFTDTTWARALGPDGHPAVLNDGSKGCLPDNWGGTNFMPPSFDPALRLFFVTARETCATYLPEKQVIAPGRFSLSGVVRRDLDKAYGALRAIDATTGERRWEFTFQSPSFAGVLSTASGVVFGGDNEGNFMAFDARTGRNLWHYQTGSPIWGGAPMTYMLDERQYVIIGSGTTITAFALP
jgi:alcohol dehydrogenase (cytochrome c)